MNICVFGASSSELAPEFYTEAERLGAALAERGHTLVFGAGNNGLMGAVARGFSSRGGRIIGIAPKFFDEPGILYEHCTELIFTETMRERKQLMEEKSEVSIVLPGGIGTYEEFFEILTLKQLGRTDRAIVLLNTLGYFEPMQTLLEATAKEKFMSANCLSIYSIVNTPDDAIAAIDNYVPQKGSINRLADYNK